MTLSKTYLSRSWILAVSFVGIVTLMPFHSASAQVMLVGIDRKFGASDGKRLALSPGNDSLLVFDLKDPANPALIGNITLENSIVGPPTNLAISPDQTLALVANAVHTRRTKDENGWENYPASEVFVVDLAARPMRVIDTIKVGNRPSGISINREGTFALVANRDSNSITVLAIKGHEVSNVDTLQMGDVVTSVTISPDGHHALATKFLSNKVAQLSLSSTGKWSDDQRDLPVGLYPWNVAISPNGNEALVNNFGTAAGSDGNADTVSVVDLANVPWRITQHVSVGDAPEGLAINPSGTVAAVTLLQGSYDSPPGAWYEHKSGRVVLLGLKPGAAQVIGGCEVGSLPESVGFSPDGTYLYVGNFGNSTLSVIGISVDGTITSRRDLPLPGPPASISVGPR